MALSFRSRVPVQASHCLNNPPTLSRRELRHIYLGLKTYLSTPIINLYNKQLITNSQVGQLLSLYSHQFSRISSRFTKLTSGTPPASRFWKSL